MGDTVHFPHQQEHDHNHQHIGEHQVHYVKRPHLVAVSGDQGIPRNIMNRDFIKRVDGENQNFEGGIQNAQPQKRFPCLREFAFCEADREYQQADQHHINGGKVDAGHDGHAQVVVLQNADQIADIHHGCPRAGKPQKPAGGPVLLKGFDGQNRVNQKDYNGDEDVHIQKHRVHMGSPFSQTARLPGLRWCYSFYIPIPRNYQYLWQNMAKKIRNKSAAR